jgi:hypothetical protein
VVGVDEDVPAVVDGGKEIERLIEGVRNCFEWLKGP